MKATRTSWTQIDSRKKSLTCDLADDDDDDDDLAGENDDNASGNDGKTLPLTSNLKED